MKRYILLFFTLIVAASLLILPAAASEVDSLAEDVYSVTIDDAGDGSLEIPAGRYRVYVTDADECEYEIGEVVLDASSHYCQVVASGNASFEFCFDDGTLDIAYGGSDPVFYGSVIQFIPVTSNPPKRNETVTAVSVLDVFAGVGTWIVTSLGSVSGIFWIEATGELTVLGVLAVAALGISVVLGLVYIIVRFLKFRS